MALVVTDMTHHTSAGQTQAGLRLGCQPARVSVPTPQHGPTGTQGRT